MLDELAEFVRRDVANRVAWAAAKKCGGAEDGKATGASEASPFMLMGWSMRLIPAGKLSVSVGLPCVAEQGAVYALSTTERASLGGAGGDGHSH